MKTKIFIASALLLGISFGADAQIIRNKARNERVRIHDGVRSGELTRPEAYRLNKEQRHIRRDIHRARKDGHFDRHERKHIRHEQRTQSRRIYISKHNGRTRVF